MSRVRERSYPPSVWSPAAPPSTGATAGKPGTWTPPGSTPPTRLGLKTGSPVTVTANPATHWTLGQYVMTGDALAAYWDGAAWQNNASPTATETETETAPAPVKKAAAAK